jgi:nicotinamidase-related amidase
MKMSKEISLLCVDLQNDFSSEGGLFYNNYPSVQFLKNLLFPFISGKKVRISEIVSDYRQPRQGDERDCCRPGEWGFESVVPDSLRKGNKWIKSMNSPVWTRNGAGDPGSEPGEPYPDPERFGRWLDDHVGSRNDVNIVVVFGLTADCCVLSAVQELRWRGYEVRVLAEGTDVRSGDQVEKKMFLSTPPFTFWGSSILFDDLKQIL